MDVIEAINTRRSIRHFTDAPVGDDELNAILEAGRRAPSGLNNQPWRFVVVDTPEVMEKIAGFSKYGRVLRDAKKQVLVFFDNDAGYHRDKDMHGIGACVQNMWLVAHSLGIGMCWVGEILSKRTEVEKTAGVPGNLELMAALCFGYPEPGETKQTDRTPLEELIVARL